MNSMVSTIERRRVEGAVVEQAAEVAHEAIGKLVAATLRAAQVCGCRQCQQAAARTTLWAVMTMEPSAEPALDLAGMRGLSILRKGEWNVT